MQPEFLNFMKFMQFLNWTKFWAVTAGWLASCSLVRWPRRPAWFSHCVHVQLGGARISSSSSQARGSEQIDQIMVGGSELGAPFQLGLRW